MEVDNEPGSFTVFFYFCKRLQGPVAIGISSLDALSSCRQADSGRLGWVHPEDRGGFLLAFCQAAIQEQLFILFKVSGMVRCPWEKPDTSNARYFKAAHVVRVGVMRSHQVQLY